MILSTILQWLKQNTNQILNPQNIPYSSLLRASYRVSFMRIWEKTDHIIKALGCIFFQYSILDVMLQWVYEQKYNKSVYYWGNFISTSLSVSKNFEPGLQFIYIALENLINYSWFQYGIFLVIQVSRLWLEVQITILSSETHEHSASEKPPWSSWGPSGANRTHVGPMLAPWT